jgi:hypothetical protein
VVNKYVLTQDEWQKINTYTTEMNERARRGNYKDYVVAPELSVSLMGLMSEYCAAQILGVPFNFDSIFQVNRPDLVNGLEIRSTQHTNGNLIVYENDKPANYVLTTIDFKELSVTLVGWLHFNDCVNEKYWRTVPKVRKDSYWVPQKDLKPISDLQSTVAA